MVLIWRFKRLVPSFNIASGVLATLKSPAVALLTLISVACAESMTAINSSNGFLYFNSVAGSGSFSLRRVNICVRFSLFTAGHHGENSFIQLLSRCSGNCIICRQSQGNEQKQTGAVMQYRNCCQPANHTRNNARNQNNYGCDQY